MQNKSPSSLPRKFLEKLEWTKVCPKLKEQITISAGDALFLLRKIIELEARIVAEAEKNPEEKQLNAIAAHIKDGDAEASYEDYMTRLRKSDGL